MDFVCRVTYTTLESGYFRKADSFTEQELCRMIGNVLTPVIAAHFVESAIQTVD
jgi:hypothetical protein